MIELCMWEKEKAFYGQAQKLAENVFSELDSNLNPQVFLIGIPNVEESEHHLICLEPKDCGCDPIWFSRVDQEVKNLVDVRIEQDTFRRNPDVQEKYEQKLKDKALGDEILNIVSERFPNYESFCSIPKRVESHNVVVVLQVNKNAYDSWYSLHEGERDHQRISPSLLKATIWEYLEECEYELQNSNPGAQGSINRRSIDEIIRAAGNHFIATLGISPIDKSDYIKKRFRRLFNACNHISALRYEGVEGVGDIIVSRKHNHPYFEEVVSLKERIQIDNHRAVRKLLEVALGDLKLLSNGYDIYGLGKKRKKRIDAESDDEVDNEAIFIVRFTRHNVWELIHVEDMKKHPKMMQVVDGQPRLPKPKFESEEFRYYASQIFPELKPASIDNLHDLVKASTEQSHGTMVVVSEEAEVEAKRLSNQSTLINPIDLEKDLMYSITAVDGAVLIDQFAKCYAIGVILDGVASSKGDKSRGARYNSAIRYVDHSNYRCFAVVVSEDGYTDLIPDLPPQIKKSDVTQKVKELRALKRKVVRLRALKNIMPPDSKKFQEFQKEFQEVMRWLQKHQRYLWQEVWDEIIKLDKKIRKIYPKDFNESRFWKVGPLKFTPDENFEINRFYEAYVFEDVEKKTTNS